MKLWLTGFVVGIFFATLTGLSFVWMFKVDILDLISNLYGQRVVGETRILLWDGVLYQDGKEVGTLRRGTRLLHRLQTESLEEFYLPVGWENKGKMDQIFNKVEKTERAFVVLEATQ